MAATIEPTASREFAVPAETIFDFVADCLNDPQWCPLIESAEQLKGDGPAPGAVYRWGQVVGDGQVAPMDVTLEVVDRPHRLEWTVDNEMMSYSSWMTFQSLDNGHTRVTQVNHTTVNPAPPEAADELEAQANGIMARQMENLEGLLS